MTHDLTRRHALTALAGGAIAASLPLGARAKVAAQPEAKGAAPGIDQLIAEADLGGVVTFALADLRTGKILAARGADEPVPPASTSKIITASYALATLGRDFRFRTELQVLGPLSQGRVAGDLVLAGGGDPTLSADNLGDLAALLPKKGIRAIDGRFGVWTGALPYIPSIDPEQAVWMGYDPAVSGLNLNFNRVNFTWEPSGKGYRLGFDARAERYAPMVSIADMTAVNRSHPLFTYKADDKGEHWTVAAGALGRKGGSRWLPVRRPGLYAGDVFRTLAAAQGTELPVATAVPDRPKGQLLAAHESDPLPEILRDMLRHSTNLTAEAVGMTASARRGFTSHGASAQGMSDWLAGHVRSYRCHLVDHSGLGASSSVTARAMLEVLSQVGPAVGLKSLLKPVRFKGAEDDVKLPQGVLAKTGTLNFVSGLVGYLTTASGEERVFAIYAANLARRDAIRPEEVEHPPGLSGWLKRARRMQLKMLQGWA